MTSGREVVACGSGCLEETAPIASIRGSPEDTPTEVGDDVTMRTAVVLILALLAAACGGRVGFVDVPTTLATDAGVSELDATFQFPGFGYQIDLPSTWETASAGTLSVLFEEPRASSPTEPGRIDRPVIFFEMLALDQMGQFGIGPASTARDLAELNVGQFDLGEPTDLGDFTLAGAPSASFRSTDRFGNHVVAVQGVLGGFAYRLFFHAADAEQVDAYLPMWEAMLNSVRASS